MNKAHLSPYLVFDGNCGEAMKFYQSILGGKLEMQTFADAPMESAADMKSKIMHATLQNDTLSFMASDNMPGNTFVSGNNVHLSVAGNDEKTLTDYFNKLAVGGKIVMPLQKQFWGDVFGMLTDKYGIHWMFNIGTGMTK